MNPAVASQVADVPRATLRRSIEETKALVLGVEQCGGGKWADIKKLGYDVIAARSAVDLKDKWRNLMRVAMLPHTATRCACPLHLHPPLPSWRHGSLPPHRHPAPDPAPS